MEISKVKVQNYDRLILNFDFSLFVYFFVETIIKTTAATERIMPMTIFVDRTSPKTSVPISIAVIGSKTPSTEAFVAPIFRVEMASVAVDTTVGNSARPKMLNHPAQPSIPVVSSAPE